MASKQRRKIIALYEKHHAVLQTCSEFSIFSAPIIYFLCLYFVVPSKPAVMNNMMVRKTQDLVQPGTTMFGGSLVGHGSITCPCRTYVAVDMSLRRTPNPAYTSSLATCAHAAGSFTDEVNLDDLPPCQLLVCQRRCNAGNAAQPNNKLSRQAPRVRDPLLRTLPSTLCRCVHAGGNFA